MPLKLNPSPTLCLLALALLLNGCGGLGDATGSTCPEPSELTYENFGHGFMLEYCADCHGEYSTHDGVIGAIEEIDRAAAAGPDAVNDWMPKDKDVPKSEREELGEWLACGAP